MANVKFFDRVLVSSTTVGTGTYSLGSAIGGYQSFGGAGAASGDLVGFVAVDDLTNPVDWEVCEGSYTAGSPATLTRGTIIASSNGGLAVSWAAGTRYIFSAPSAERLVVGPKAPVTDGNLVAWDGDENHVKDSGVSFPSSSTAGNIPKFSDTTGKVLADSGKSLDFFVPTGVILPYGGTTAPTGWEICDGGTLSRTANAALFAVISTAFGAGDGSTTFNKPDMRGRVPAGSDNMGTGNANRLGSGATGGITGAAGLGATGGEQSHTLTTNEMPSHNHPLPTHDGGGGVAGNEPVGFATGSGSANYNGLGLTGGGAAHNVLQPTICLSYIIKT